MNRLEFSFEGLTKVPDVPHRSLKLANQGPQTVVPETVLLEAGHGDGLDIVRSCDRHQWSSLRVPFEPNCTRPTCPICEAERLYWDGFARYRDLAARKRAGVL